MATKLEALTVLQGVRSRVAAEGYDYYFNDAVFENQERLKDNHSRLIQRLTKMEEILNTLPDENTNLADTLFEAFVTALRDAEGVAYQYSLQMTWELSHSMNLMRAVRPPRRP